MRGLFAVLLAMLVCFSATSQGQEYQYYSDRDGRLYLKAPDTLLVLPGAKAAAIRVPAANGYLSIYVENGTWHVRVLSAQEWRALSLTPGHDDVSTIRYSDMDDDGQSELFIALRHTDATQLLVRHLDTQPEIESAYYEAQELEGVAQTSPVFTTFAAMATPKVAALSAGEFRVDESGAANYNIPLSLPQGIAGVMPQLAFNYNSSGGDGYMGAGWRFSGGSAITRCPKNLSTDTLQGNVSFSATDRLCLDGQRLIRNGVSHDKATTDAAYWNVSTQFHTELDGFTLIRQHGAGTQGPLAFSAETKSGEIHYYGKISAVSGNDTMGKALALTARSYGNTAESGDDAFFDTALNSNTARLWALKAIRDVKGNYIVFKYHEDQALGEHYLTEVHYTGRSGGAAPFARVILNYVDNTKIATGWQAGSKVAMTKLLDTVTVYQDAAVYRHYRLNYFNSNVLEEKNYLLSLQECADTGNNNCLPQTTFNWQRPPEVQTGYEPYTVSEYGVPDYTWNRPLTRTFAPFAASAVNRGSSVERYSQHLIDLNGDGHVDMVYPRANLWRVRLGGANNYTTETTMTSVGVGKKEFAQTIDYNGDGLRDLLVANSANDNWHIITYLPSTYQYMDCEPDGQGGKPCIPMTATRNYTLVDTGLKAIGLEGGAIIADYDGDGLEDIVFVSGGSFQAYRNKGVNAAGSHLGFEHKTNLGFISGTLNQTEFNPAFYTADQKSASAVDINGDGRTDILLKITTGVCRYAHGAIVPGMDKRECHYERFLWSEVTQWKVFISNGTSYSLTQELSDFTDLRTVDLNGDGYTDILYRSGTTWYYRLSDGTQLLPARSTGLSTPNDRVNLTYFLDLNGDGRTDILLPTANNQWFVFLSRPTKSHQQIIFEQRGVRFFDANAAIQFADVDGDGKLDMLTATNDNGWRVFNGQRAGIKEHVISGITSGFDVTTEITYKSITDKNVYFRNVSSNHAGSDYFSPQAGMYVVSKVSTETGSNQSVSVNYQYGGLLLHKKGRGMLGFEVLRTLDNQSGVLTETLYHQQWPYTGIPKSTVQYKGDNLLSSATNTVTQRTTAYGGILPYISNSSETSYQLGSDGQRYGMNKTVSSFTYDNYGNLTASTVVQSPPDNTTQKRVTQTSNTFNQSVLYQRYGRLTASTVTNTLNGNSSTSQSRRSSFTYNGDLMLATEVISPEDVKTQVTTTYGYDVAGNITSKQVTAATKADGTAMATRSQGTVWDSRFRYVASQTDSSGQTLRYTYNGLAPASVSGNISYIDTTDSNNQSTRQYFDAIGRNYRSYVKGATSADTAVNRYTYWELCSSVSCTPAITGAYMQVRSVADAQPESKLFLDKYGREIGQSIPLADGTLSVSQTVYDEQGRPSQTYEPGINTPSSYFSTAKYDVFGRIYSTILASGGSSTIDYKGLSTITTDPMGKKTTTINNYLGQTARVIDHLGNKLDYAYDAYGNLLTVTATDVNNLSRVRTTNYYDHYGRKYQMDDQDKGLWKYSYNAFGELVSQTDAKTQTTSFTYDNAGRMLRRFDASGTTCWDYGTSSTVFNVGKLTQVSSYSGNALCTTPADPLYRESYTYNSKGLQSSKLVQTPQGSFRTSSSYDSYGRLDLLTYPSWSLNPTQDDIVIKHVYQHGALKQLKDNKTNRIYQDVTKVNARGQATDITYGNGVIESRGFNPQSGWLSDLSLKKGSSILQNSHYQYDASGNVKERQQRFGVGSNAGMREVFLYDDLHRVKSRTVSNLSSSSGYNSLPATLRMNESYNYDHWGNITAKTNVGHYQYDATKTNRLTGVWQNSGFSGTKYYSMGYDSNGNVTSDGKRAFTYTPFDKPVRVTQGSHTTDFSYGSDRQLYRRVDVRDGKTTESLYIDGVYERTTLPSGVQEHKFYVGHAVITKRSNNAHDELYLHKDNQGSTISITNATGSVLQQFIYDPWGKQYSVATNSLFTTYSNPGTSKGYTGHNMVNDVDVIHMGGRTYNPVLGRFMQADPFIQAPHNLQNYNRYSYVMNNPMSYTDPSGYFLKKLMKVTGVTSAMKFLARTPILNAIAQIAAAYYGGPAGAALYSFAQNYAVTGSLGQAIRSGAIAYATARAFQRIGEHFSNAGLDNIGTALENNADFSGLYNFGGNLLTSGQVAGQIALHAMAGGVSSSLSGSKFGHGFFAAGVTKGAGGAFLPGGSNLSGGQVIYGTVISAVIGGTASEVSGGKFYNGARTAAFQYLFNQAGKWSYKRLAELRQVRKGADAIAIMDPSHADAAKRGYFPKGVFVVAAHGNENGIIIDGLRNTLDITVIDTFMRQHGYSGEMSIFLSVCHSGTSGVAQIMANYYNVTVIAPSSGNTYSSVNGPYYLEDPKAYYKEFNKND